MPSSKPDIGFIGLRIMGRPMALNLLEAGYPLAVYTRRPAAARPLADAGAKAYPTSAQLAAHTDIVITMVADTPDVEAVILGKAGLVQGFKPGSVVTDMSTIAPAATRRLAAELATRGIDMLDAPVSGDYKPGFKSKLHHKDIHIALRTASESGVKLRGAEQAAHYLNELVATGDGELDSAAIATVVDRLAKQK